jgi:hypothetical protein
MGVDGCRISKSRSDRVDRRNQKPVRHHLPVVRVCERARGDEALGGHRDDHCSCKFIDRHPASRIYCRFSLTWEAAQPRGSLPTSGSSHRHRFRSDYVSVSRYGGPQHSELSNASHIPRRSLDTPIKVAHSKNRVRPNTDADHGARSSSCGLVAFSRSVGTLALALSWATLVEVAGIEPASEKQIRTFIQLYCDRGFLPRLAGMPFKPLISRQSQIRGPFKHSPIPPRTRPGFRVYSIRATKPVAQAQQHCDRVAPDRSRTMNDFTFRRYLPIN